MLEESYQFLPHKKKVKLVKGAFDFFGLNHYSTLSVKDDPKGFNMKIRDIVADMGAITLWNPKLTHHRGRMCSSGLYRILDYLKIAYGNPPTYIHENGLGTKRDGALEDSPRVKYVQSYIGTLLDGISDGANTKGYFLWSFLDGFELLGGYKTGFGLYYVDLDDGELRRYPKLSAHWYSN